MTAVCCFSVLFTSLLAVADASSRCSNSYFDEINRLLAYVAIWFPLWFRLLSRVSPALSDEELERREKLEFQRQLDHLVQDEDQVDD